MVAYLAFTAWLVILPVTESRRRKHDAVHAAAEETDSKTPLLQQD